MHFSGFVNKQKFVKVIFFFLILTVIGLGGKLLYSRLFSKADVLEPALAKHEIKYISNEVLVKVSQGAKSKLGTSRTLSASSVGVSSLSKVNQRFGALKMDKVSPTETASSDINRWYKVTLGNKKEIIEGSLDEKVFTTNSEPESARYSMRDFIDAYKNTEGVELAEPNYIESASFIPNDYHFSSTGLYSDHDDMWDLKKINTQAAWDQTKGENVTVAVVDTGVDYFHPDLKDSILRDSSGKIIGFNAIDGSNLPFDDQGHGTHVAGTIAAAINNDLDHSSDSGKRVVGVAPGVKIMPVKFLDSNGSGSSFDGAGALIFAIDNGAQIINNSWGGPPTNFFDDIINYAYSKNVVLVFAAGNENQDVVNTDPAGNPRVITVGASNYKDAKACFSNTGDRVDIVAPGGDSASCGGANDYTLSTKSSGNKISYPNVGNYYLQLRGTSMAAPHVAGLAALIKSKHPDYTIEEIRATIRNSADKINDLWSDQTGFGRVNANNSLILRPQPVAFIDIPEGLRITNSSPLKVNGKISSRNGILKWELWLKTEIGATGTLLTSGDTAKDGLIYDGTNLSKTTDGNFILNLKVIDNQRQMSNSFVKLNFDNQLMNNWPVEFPGAAGKNSQASIADINGDGLREIIYSTFSVDELGYFSSKLAAFKPDGSLLPGFPKLLDKDTFINLYTAEENTDATIADVNLDGKDDIVVITTSREGPYGTGTYRNKVWVIQGNGENLPAFPKEFVHTCPNCNRITVSPIVDDVNADGKPEIFFAGFDAAYVLDNTGSPLPGWPVKYDNMGFDTPPYNQILVNDFNNDGKKELFINSAKYFAEYGAVNAEVVTAAYNIQGQVLPGWPKKVANGSPVPTNIYSGFADINNDNKKELVSKICNYAPYSAYPTDHLECKIFALNQEGKELWNVKVPIENNGAWSRNISIPVFADLTPSPGIETLFSIDSKFVIIDGSGEIYNLNNFANTSFYPYPLSLADLNGDGSPEIFQHILETAKRQILVRAYDRNGAIKWERGGGNDWLPQAPAISDIDNDGKLEVIAAGVSGEKDLIFVWKTQFDSRKTLWWSQPFRNARHESTYSRVKDVLPSNPFYREIIANYEQNPITVSKCSAISSDYCFFPDKLVSRSEAAYVFASILKLPSYSGTEQPFSDVPTTHPLYKYIMAIYKTGLSVGCANDPLRFCPDGSVNRAEMAVFLARAKNIQPYNNPMPSFTDVPVTYPVYQYIEAIYKAGYTNGCSTNPLKYCPGDSLTRGQMAAFISRAFNFPQP